MGTRKIGQRGRSVRVALVGLVLVAGYAVVGTLHTLVWNPLAAVPGATMEEIHAGLDQANESLGAPVVIVWAAVGVLLAAGLVVVGAGKRSDLPAKTVLVIDLLLLVFAAPSHWCAAFPAGMGIADAFATHGGDHAPWGIALYAASALALAALFAIAVVTRFGRADSAP